jgi:hypothetical protein
MNDATNSAQAGAAGASAAAKPLREYSHTLKHPVEVRTRSGDLVETVTVITMKRPKAKHMREMDKASGQMGKVLLLIQATSGVPMSVVDEIDGEDVTALAEVVGDFFGVSLSTGST